MELLMGIDIGSTNTKAVAFDVYGKVYAEGSVETKLSFDADHPTWTCWQPDDIWNGARTAISRVTAALPEGCSIKALACSCFSADFVPIDKNGDALYPFKSWHCGRTVPQMQEWLETHSQNDVFYRHGRATEKLLSMFTMRWMCKNVPEVVEKTWKILLVSDYVVFKLTGQTVTDYTQAASSGLFDPRAGEWSEDYLTWGGFRTEQMPTALLAGTPVGRITPEAAAATGLSQDTLVVIGAHDNECAVFAMGMKDESAAYNVCGTWDMIIALHKDPGFNEGRANRSIAVARYMLPDSFISIKFGIAGSLMEWAKKNFYGAEREAAKAQGVSVWETILAETAKSPMGSNGIMALPFQAGGMGEDRKQLAAGTILGIDSYLSKADVMHAVFEGLEYQTRNYLENIEAVCERRYDRIISVGGPTRNRQLMQIKADVCKRPVVVAEVPEGTAMGAAMLAGIGAGMFKDGLDAIEHVTRNRSCTIYEPDPEKAAFYDKGYETFCRASELLRTL